MIRAWRSLLSVWIYFPTLMHVGYGDVSVYPNPSDIRLSTPSLALLASEGMMFTQAYAGYSVCAPSRYGPVWWCLLHMWDRVCMQCVCVCVCACVRSCEVPCYSVCVRVCVSVSTCGPYMVMYTSMYSNPWHCHMRRGVNHGDRSDAPL